MGERNRGAGNAHTGGSFSGAAMEEECRPAARFPYHFNLKPVHPVADTCAQSLGSCFLGCEPGSEAFGREAFAQAIGLLARSVDAVEEALAEAIDGVLDALNLNQVDAGTYDHPVYEATTG